MQLSSSGAMNYATLSAGTGLTVTQSSGSISIALGSMLDLGSSTPTLNDSGGAPILGLSSSGSGNYVTIANDTTTTIPPAGPLISVAGPGTGAIPLQIGDRAGGGVELNSNGGLAMKVTSSSATPTTYAAVNATPSGTFAGNSGVQVAAANAAGTGDLSLVLKGQNSGSVFVGSNLDVAGSALAVEVPADPTTGVIKGRLAYINSSGNAIVPAAAQRPLIGVALNTATSGSAIIAYAGRVQCVFENTPVPGDYVIPGSTLFPKCHDGGTSYSMISSGQIIGTVLDATGYILLRISN